MKSKDQGTRQVASATRSMQGYIKTSSPTEGRHDIYRTSLLSSALLYVDSGCTVVWQGPGLYAQIPSLLLEGVVLR